MGGLVKDKGGIGAEGEIGRREDKQATITGSHLPPSRISAQDSASTNSSDNDEAALDAYSYRFDGSLGGDLDGEGGGGGGYWKGGDTTTSTTKRRKQVNNGGDRRRATDQDATSPPHRHHLSTGVSGDGGEKKMNEEEEGQERQGKQQNEHAAAVRYFCKPNSTTLLDVFLVCFYHLFPFSIFAPIVEFLFLKWAVGKFGSIVWTIFFSVSFVLITIPGYYSPSLRKALRCLYVPLAKYMKSLAFIVPGDLGVSPPPPPPPSSSSSSSSPNDKHTITTAAGAGVYDKRNESRPCIYAVHPHGRVFYTPTMLGQLHDTWHEGALGRKNDIFVGASSGFFYVPLLRNLLYALGVIPVSKYSVVRKLRAGHDVIIVVGGIKEVSLGTSDDEDVLFLARRKGFIKLAIEENVGVVPVYCFNENSLFKHDPKWFLKFWEKVNRLIVIGVPLFRGVWNTPMPYRRNILVAFGEPMFAKEGENTDAFHARYMQELKSLYNNHVALSGCPNHKLVIV